MTIAASPAHIPTPLREEGIQFWKQLIEECKNRVSAINCSLSAQDRDSKDQIELRAGEYLSLSRLRYPSTLIAVRITFEHWGQSSEWILQVTKNRRSDSRTKSWSCRWPQMLTEALSPFLMKAAAFGPREWRACSPKASTVVFLGFRFLARTSYPDRVYPASPETRAGDLSESVYRPRWLPAAAGAAAGVGFALLLARVMQSLLFHVNPFDPTKFFLIPAFLVAVCAVPATCRR